LKYREYVVSDLEAPNVVRYDKLLKLKPGETVVFAAIEFKSEAHRNTTMKKIYNDPDLNPPEGEKMPFDFRRMVYGGFKILVDL
jgi:uncharacterized protein YbaA (DUF1428 family)